MFYFLFLHLSLHLINTARVGAFLMEIKNWKFNRLGVVILFLLYQNLILCSSLNEEGMALLRLRERIVSDPYGALNSWKMDFGEIDHCSWFGVECSHDGKVVVLNLKDLCLEGMLAPEITNLVHIKSIILRNNSFTGIIPEGIGELKELEVLDFGYNNFSGPLPLDLGSNLSLAILLLDNNEQLSSLSPEIQHLDMLSEFQVDKNQLSNAVKGSSCNKRSITWNAAHTENAVHRRQMQNNHKLLPSTPPSPKPATPTVTSPPPPTMTSPAPTPSEPFGTSSAPDGSASPSISAPAPSNSSVPGVVFESSRSKKNQGPIIAGAVGGTSVILVSIISIYICKINKVSVNPWATGLSGQLQKAFVTGVPKLKRSELEAGCEDFSNVIGSSPIGTLYKGTLSSGVEIAVLAVASVAVTSAKDWSRTLQVQFRQKIEKLSKVNHKNFVNLLGYCEEEEPFTRMMVFEYAPNGTLFEHLHVKESEHLDWGMRLRIAMGMAYCLEHMHQLNPPIAHNNLSSSDISLTEDYASKIADFTFSNNIIATEMELSSKKLPDLPLACLENNVYNFGVLLFEMVTGRLPYSVDNVSLEDWASDYLRGYQPLKEMIDPTLDSFDEEKLERIGEVIKSCVHRDPKRRPAMRDVTARLREITALTPDAAIPKLSPLWWAELEILSTEAS
ncbi:inactive receptor-like serine/threonine-protein kinase At2g40270 [Populus nigra]|uniref:inactive receptor-like serine/threonine-protein kinase At2g40270 n=1 Tax=Populus nigra TaxID=3691 RepID=UPI002B279AC9|nr:inactive receptor-like serine/threonine-protein kinase At2g40270 [Populus nigra]